MRANAGNLTEPDFLEQLRSADIENHIKEKIQKIWENDPNVTDFAFMDNWLGVEGAKLVARALENNNCLTKITLGLCDLGPEGIIAIAKALETHPSLTHVDFSSSVSDDYEDGPEPLEKMADALKQLLEVNKVLKSLGLGDTKLGYDSNGGQIIAEGIKNNQHLTSLDLCANCLNSEAGQAIEEALNINRTLQELNLVNNEIPQETLDSIQNLVTQNKSHTTVIER